MPNTVANSVHIRFKMVAKGNIRGINKNQIPLLFIQGPLVSIAASDAYPVKALIRLSQIVANSRVYVA